MHTYLLAVNLFALTALFLALTGFPDEMRNERLPPLFLLVISRSLALIVALASLATDIALTILGALEVLTIFCIVWALAGSPSGLAPRWRQVARLGGVGALCLTLLSLLPFWPVPFQIQGLLIAIVGALLIFMRLGENHWLAVAAPFILAVANFLSLLSLVSLSGLVNLLAYAVFIGALHWQTLHIYARRQQAVQSLVQQADELNQERQRWLEVSEMISNMPNLNHSLEHIVRSIAQATQVDQAAIFVLDAKLNRQAHLLTLYSPQHPFHVTDPGGVGLTLANCPPLQQAVTSQKQLLLARPALQGLDMLYDLWREERSGPTLLQPLVTQRRPIGVLMLGNPVSQQPIRESDARLCRNVAAQIATLVEHRRRYLELDREAEAIARAVKKRAEAPDEQQIAILEAISDGVVVCNVKGRVQFANQAAEHILGKPGRALIGQPIDAIYSQIDGRKPIEDLVVAFSRRNQPLPTFIEAEERALQGRLAPWRNKEGEWLGIIAIFRDVTREVKADRARDDFIAALSRELRTPLTMVRGYTELITNEVLGDYPPQLLEMQYIINSNAERMAEILDNAIRISAQNRHRVLPRFEEIDITKIIDGVLREIAPLVRMHELELTRELEADLPPMTADPKHIHRILYNLLANACRYTPPRGWVRIRAWAQLGNRGPLTRSYLFITVADNGVGIPQEETNRVFDRFYRLKNQNPTKRSGMGMGLTVVNELVELHNGRVWVESVLGEGSTFHIVLPTDQAY